LLLSGILPVPNCADKVELILLAFLRNCSNNNAMSDVVQSVRQLLQDFIAPELRELKSDIKRIDSKIDGDTTRLDDKVTSEAKRLENKIDSESRQLGADFKRLESKVDSGFAHLESLLENANLRAELESTRDLANLRERVTRLEVERTSQRQ
jgi:hypothetical protein